MGWKEIDWKAVGRFLILAAPFTVLGAFGFAKVPKGPMTVVLCSFLIVFAIMKLRGKMHHSYSGKNSKFGSIRKLQNGKNPNMQTRNGHYLTGSGLFHLYDSSFACET